MECDEIESCNGACEMTPGECGDSIMDDETALQAFQEGQLVVLQQIASIVTQKKQLEDQEKELKDTLQKAMEAHGVKKFESDILNITYVAATTSTSVDSAKLKRKYPAIAEECSKVSNKSAYVKVTVK